MTETLLNKQKNIQIQIQIQIILFRDGERNFSERERERESRGFLMSVHIHNLDGVIITLQSLIFYEIINNCTVCIIL